MTDLIGVDRRNEWRKWKDIGLCVLCTDGSVCTEM